MNVKQLIEKLQNLDPNALVVVDGYEDGFHAPEDVKPLLVHGPYPENHDWEGEYEEDGTRSYRTDKIKPAMSAVYLSRNG